MDERQINEFLEASGAVAIGLVEAGGAFSAKVLTLRQAKKLPPNHVVWLSRSAAIRVTRASRRGVASATCIVEAVDALTKSADKIGVGLTPHTTIVARARNLSTAITAQIERLRNDGSLREFNSAYSARRKSAAAQGNGFMTYSVAMARLRKALITTLVTGSGMPVKSLFEEVLRNADHHNEEKRQ